MLWGVYCEVCQEKTTLWWHHTVLSTTKQMCIDIFQCWPFCRGLTLLFQSILQSSLVSVLLMTEEHVRAINREDLVAQQGPLTAFFCQTLDIRNAETQVSEGIRLGVLYWLNKDHWLHSFVRPWIYATQRLRWVKGLDSECCIVYSVVRPWIYATQTQVSEGIRLGVWYWLNKDHWLHSFVRPWIYAMQRLRWVKGLDTECCIGSTRTTDCILLSDPGYTQRRDSGEWRD